MHRVTAGGGDSLLDRAQPGKLVSWCVNGHHVDSNRYSEQLVPPIDQQC